MASAFPTGTVTFLFTDIEGSTKLLQRLGPAYAAVLADHQRLLRQAWAANQGVEIDTAGDGFFVVFASAPHAVAAAAQAQHALSEHAWPDGSVLRVRMGLHTGTPQLTGDRYVGIDVHRAARIMAAGHGGQVLLSQTTHSLVEHELPAGATLRDLGTYQLKDLEHGERLWQLLLPGLTSDFPPLKTLDARPHDLPPRATGFVGREADLQTVRAALLPTDSQTAACVAIVGMGGLGKSSLASEAVYALAAPRSAFPGGITWVRCDERAGLDGLTWIEDQLLAAWGAALPPEATARAATPEEGLALRERALGERLRPNGDAPVATPALVLFDNLERDLPLSRLLDTITPLGITALVTSRSEPSAPRIRLVRLETLDVEAGSRLFAERYSARGGSWNAARDESAAAALVAALGGLPLAIELAAARAARTRLPLSALAEELRAPDALARLADPLDASASVRYSLGKTLLALTTSQRTRFAALGLPDGPDWPLPVVERMLAGVPAETGIEATPAPVDLEALLSYSLVGLTTTDGDITSRVRLHPLVRDLAREQWARLPDADQNAALAGLIVGVRDWVAQHPLASADAYQALARDEGLVAGALRAASSRRVALLEVMQTIQAWEQYMLFGRSFPLLQEMNSLRLEAARAAGDHAKELVALRALAMAVRNEGNHPNEAIAYMREAVGIARQIGDQAQLIASLGSLGSILAEHGSRTEIEQMHDEASELASSLGDQLTDFGALNNLGSLAAKMGHREEAERWYLRALGQARIVGNNVDEMMALANLGYLADETGDSATVRRWFEDALTIAQKVNSGYGAAVILNVLGALALRAGDIETAARHFAEALALAEQLSTAGITTAVKGSLALLAGVQAKLRGERDAAVQEVEEALRLFDLAPDAPSLDQRPWASALLAELRSQSAGDREANGQLVAGASSGASAGVEAAPVLTSAPAAASRARRRWWPWRRR